MFKLEDLSFSSEFRLYNHLSTNPVDKSTKVETSNTRDLGQFPPLQILEATTILPEVCSLTTGGVDCPPKPESEKTKDVNNTVRASPGVLTAEEDIITDNNNIETNPRPVQKLGEALRSSPYTNKNKEQLQEVCKGLKLPISGTKTELMRRIIKRERRTASSFFSIKVAGTPEPAATNLPDQGGPPSTSRKPPPNILPKTPSSRRKREEDSTCKEATPSKKCKEKVRIKVKKEEDVRVREEVQTGRTLEISGEATTNFMSDSRDQGGQRSVQAMKKEIPIKKLLLIQHSQSLGEDTGRPREANGNNGGGQIRDV